jgi:hypothetical protein
VVIDSFQSKPRARIAGCLGSPRVEEEKARGLLEKILRRIALEYWKKFPDLKTSLLVRT